MGAVARDKIDTYCNKKGTWSKYWSTMCTLPGTMIRVIVVLSKAHHLKFHHVTLPDTETTYIAIVLYKRFRRQAKYLGYPSESLTQKGGTVCELCFDTFISWEAEGRSAGSFVRLSSTKLTNAADLRAVRSIYRSLGVLYNQHAVRNAQTHIQG